MPTYHAAGIRARLGITNLDQTITRHLKTLKEQANSQAEDVEQKLRKSAFLPEKVVPGPDGDGFRVSFLGNVPFLQAEANIATVASHDTAPQALSLHVLLSEKTFLRSFDNDKPQHLKIDVFLNAERTNCLHAAPRDFPKNKPFHQIFAGTRVGWLTERPWVILSPVQSPARGASPCKQTLDTRERWNKICEALIKEADEGGFNEHGDRPPSADYLVHLASMQMPDIQNLQQDSGLKFGIVDVVITCGQGAKLTGGVSYNKQPSRLTDRRFRQRKDTAKDVVCNSNAAAENGIYLEDEHTLISDGPAQEATKVSSEDLERRAAPFRLGGTPLSSDSKPPPYLHSAHKDSSSPIVSRVSRLRQPRSSNDGFNTVSKVDSNPPTGMFSFSPRAKPFAPRPIPAVDNVLRRIIIRGSGGKIVVNKQLKSPRSIAPRDPTSSRRSTYFSPSKAPKTPPPTSPVPGRRRTIDIANQKHSTVGKDSDADSSNSSRLSSPPPSPVSSFAPLSTVKSKPKVKRNRERGPQKLNTALGGKLSVDCVISYAHSEEDEEVLRQVKAERPGVFEEAGVVVGIRFFVPA